jgi:hypothetical protein
MSYESRSPSRSSSTWAVQTQHGEDDGLEVLIEAVVRLHCELSKPLTFSQSVSNAVSNPTVLEEALSAIDSLITAARRDRRLRIVSSV